MPQKIFSRLFVFSAFLKSRLNLHPSRFGLPPKPLPLCLVPQTARPNWRPRPEGRCSGLVLIWRTSQFCLSCLTMTSESSKRFVSFYFFSRKICGFQLETCSDSLLRGTVLREVFGEKKWEDIQSGGRGMHAALKPYWREERVANTHCQHKPLVTLHYFVGRCILHHPNGERKSDAHRGKFVVFVCHSWSPPHSFVLS